MTGEIAIVIEKNNAVPPPRVSIILPAYNRETLVSRAIDSVLAQTYGDFELIIVDDASKDGTRQVLEGYRHHPKVRLILSDTNRGGSGARNLGIEAARGELIAFQDSDDVWLPGKLAAQVTALDADPAAGICYCGSLFSEGDRSYYIPHAELSKLDGDMSREMLRLNATSTQTLLIRKSVLAKSGLFDISLKRFQDWDLMIRVAQITRFIFLPEPMVVIFATPGNISSVVQNDAISRARILEKYADIFSKSPEYYARNHYITARIWQKLNEQIKARVHLKKSLRMQPGLRPLAFLLRSYLQ
jgi:glycosyltransferase involved in cell wall biosynthesis